MSAKVVDINGSSPFMEGDCFKNFNGAGVLCIDDLSPPPPKTHPKMAFKGVAILKSIAQIEEDDNVGVRAGGTVAGTIQEIRLDMQMNGWRVDQPLIAIAIKPNGEIIILDGRHRYEALELLAIDGIPVAIYEVEDFSESVLRDIGHAFNQRPPSEKWKEQDGEQDLLLALRDGELGDNPTLEDLKKFAYTRSWAQSRNPSVVGRVVNRTWTKFEHGEHVIRKKSREGWESHFANLGFKYDSWKVGHDKRNDLRHGVVFDLADYDYRAGQMWGSVIQDAIEQNTVVKIVLFSTSRITVDQCKTDYASYAAVLNRCYQNSKLKYKPYELYVAPLFTTAHKKQYENGEIIALETINATNATT